MSKVVKYKDIECQECCLSCNQDINKCEYKKQRRRAINRMIYKAKKEYEKSKVGD